MQNNKVFGYRLVKTSEILWTISPDIYYGKIHLAPWGTAFQSESEGGGFLIR